MITKQQRETIGQLIGAKATALAVLNQSDFASELKAHAAFDYVRASDELDAYLDGLVSEDDTAAASSDDGWIEWGGGDCPVPKGTRIDVMHRDGEDHSGVFALGPFNFKWQHTNNDGDIIAYRVVSE